MKAKLEYIERKTAIVDVPKKYQFWFNKDEDEYTDKEWDIVEKGNILLNILKQNNIKAYDDDIEVIDFWED